MLDSKNCHFMDFMNLTRLIALAQYGITATLRLTSSWRNQDSQLPYKSLIGQVILDKNKSAAGLCAGCGEPWVVRADPGESIRNHPWGWQSFCTYFWDAGGCPPTRGLCKSGSWNPRLRSIQESPTFGSSSKLQECPPQEMAVWLSIEPFQVFPQAALSIPGEQNYRSPVPLFFLLFLVL